MAENMREVKLEAALCERAEQKFAPRFGGLEPFLNHVLRELLREDAAAMDQKERLMIEQRLKDLGYM